MNKSVLITMSVLLSSILTTISCTTTSASAKEPAATAPAAETIVNANSTTVKLLGRTVTKGDSLWLTLSGSGVEFTVTAKSVRFELVGDTTARLSRGATPTNYARFAVYVDGTEVLVDSMNCAKKEVVAFSGNTVRTATVRLIKITEAAQSLMAIKAITLDDKGTIAPTAAKALKIEVIGDSITCGYGVEAANQNVSFSTQTQNVTKAYGYLAAQALDMDYSMVSYSGFGIISGYTGNGAINTASLVPPIYEKVCMSWGSNAFNSVAWDFSTFEPNVIVVNLGTNDNSYTKGNAAKCAKYTEWYVSFLKTIRAHNQKAHLICTLGIMGDELYGAVQKAAADYTAETGDKNISTFHFAVQNGNADGYGADWHPSAKTQQKEADLLTAYLKSLIDAGTIRK